MDRCKWLSVAIPHVTGKDRQAANIPLSPFLSDKAPPTSHTTLRRTLVALPFMVVVLVPSVLSPPPCLPPTPWAPSEAGQDPPRPLGPGSLLPPLLPLRHLPLLQSPRQRQAPSAAQQLASQPLRGVTVLQQIDEETTCDNNP
ncbi:hypothetical protein NQZ68_021096 [Dissostichus eleginoides]|nr:hypothetical protein NQZ68_021096 [Dissostichus eleginoides]